MLTKLYVAIELMFLVAVFIVKVNEKPQEWRRRLFRRLLLVCGLPLVGLWFGW
jgi:hypothetical protein